jgi:hypothetical protein
MSCYVNSITILFKCLPIAYQDAYLLAIELFETAEKSLFKQYQVLPAVPDF